MTSIAHYAENSDFLEFSSHQRHRHDATSMIDIGPLGLVALVVSLVFCYSCYFSSDCCVTSFTIV